MPRVLRPRNVDKKAVASSSSAASIASSTSSASSAAKPTRKIAAKASRNAKVKDKDGKKEKKASVKSARSAAKRDKEVAEKSDSDPDESEPKKHSASKKDSGSKGDVAPSKSTSNKSEKSKGQTEASTSKPVTSRVAAVASTSSVRSTASTSRRPIYMSSESSISATQATSGTQPSTQMSLSSNGTQDKEHVYDLNRDEFGPDPPKRRRTTKKSDNVPKKGAVKKRKKARAVLAFGEEPLEVVKEAIRGIDNLTFSPKKEGPKLKERSANIDKSATAHGEKEKVAKKRPLILTTRPVDPNKTNLKRSYTREPSVIFRSLNKENESRNQSASIHHQVEGCSQQSDSVVSIAERCDQMHLAPGPPSPVPDFSSSHRARTPSPVHLNFSNAGQKTPQVVNFAAMRKDKISTPRVDENGSYKLGKRRKMVLEKKTLKELIDENFGFSTDDEEEAVNKSKDPAPNISSVGGREISPVRKIGNGHNLLNNPTNDNAMEVSIFSPLPVKSNQQKQSQPAQTTEKAKEQDGGKMLPPKLKALISKEEKSKTKLRTNKTKQTLIYEVVKGSSVAEYKQLKGGGRNTKRKNFADSEPKETMSETRLFSDEEDEPRVEGDSATVVNCTMAPEKKRKTATYERKRHSSNKLHHHHQNANNNTKSNPNLEGNNDDTTISQDEEENRTMVDSQLSHFEEINDFELTFVSK